MLKTASPGVAIRTDLISSYFLVYEMEVGQPAPGGIHHAKL